METIKKGARPFLTIILLILAAFGIGMMGNFLNPNRERYMDNEIRIEHVTKRDDDDDEDELKE